MVTVTIDGNKFEVAEGTTVLRAAESAGVHIPTLCDHKSLTPYGGCRLCLVEVEGMRTLQPSCTLPVMPNMVVHTASEKVKEARKFVLTLIFSERNHFCMYCQVSGGDCELQNAAYAEGMDHWPLQPNWQPYAVDASHPYFVLDNNRCILCRRCVRACAELIGNFTLGIEERGANSYLVADLGTPLGESTCISCGSCVQVCPTGALIDRQSAYRGRVKDSQKTKTICTQCSVGCGIETVHRDNTISRIEGDWENGVNQGVLCGLGRFEPLAETRNRLATPMVRKDNALKAARYEDAIAAATVSLKDGGVAALVSSSLSGETLSGFKKVFSDGVKGASVGSFDEGEFTSYASSMKTSFKKSFEGGLSDLENADLVITVGTDLNKNHQVVGFMVKRGQPYGKKLMVIAGKDDQLKDFADEYLPLNGKTAEPFEKAGASDLVKKASKVVVVTGKDVAEKPEVFAANLSSFVADLKKAGKEVSVISVKGNANGYAAYLLGLDQAANLKGAKAAFVFLGEEEPSQKLMKELENVPFLFVQGAYASPLTARANVVIPAPIWSEQAGHFINLEGKIQSTVKVLSAPDGVAEYQTVFTDLAKAAGVKLDGDWTKGLDKSLLVTELIEA
jgi:formate dehydrogenase major subunit